MAAAPPATTQFVNINGVRAGVSTVAESRLALTVRLADVWLEGPLAVIEGPMSTGSDALADALRSVPMLDPASGGRTVGPPTSARS